MADTRIQIEVEDWVRRNWMPTHFGKKFFREHLKIRSGGVFDFDAVSDDASIVGTISTSGSKTSEITVSASARLIVFLRWPVAGIAGNESPITVIRRRAEG